MRRPRLLFGVLILVFLIGFCLFSLFRQWGPREDVPYIDISYAAGLRLGRELAGRLPDGSGRVLVLQSFVSDADRRIAEMEMSGLREGLSARADSGGNIHLISEGLQPGHRGPEERIDYDWDWNAFSAWLREHQDVDAVISFIGIPYGYVPDGIPAELVFLAMIYGYSDEWEEPMRTGVLDGVLVRRMKVDDSIVSRKARNGEDALELLYRYFEAEDID